MINKMLHLLLSVIVVSLAGLVIPSAFAENVPDWVKIMLDGGLQIKLMTHHSFKESNILSKKE